MKVFETPMVVMSLLAVCLLPDPQVPVAHADFVFGERVNLGPTVNSPQAEGNPVFSPDGLELYFVSDRPGGYGSYDIWMSKRASTNDPWGPPVNLGAGINSTVYDFPSSVSSDGLTLYLFAQTGLLPDLYTATRFTKDAPWGPRVNMGSVLNGPEGGSDLWGSDYVGLISPDDLELFYASWRASCIGAADIFVSTRATPSDSWGPPVNLGPIVNTFGRDFPGGISPDGLTLFINVDSRSDGLGGWDMWMTRRPYKGAPWSEPVNLGPSLNTSRPELGGISPDGQWAYIYDAQENGMPLGSADLWMVPIIPIVDFTGDGQVDGKDLLVMIVEFGGTDTLCDIGPMPWGDGVVDFKDFKVLAEYIGKNVDDPTLVAHWPFDETLGLAVQDVVGQKNGWAMNGAVWQPDGGMVGGALELDGVDDIVLVNEALEPGDGAFGFIVWIKGAGPGQTVVSHGGTRLLYTNPIDGSLMTDLSGARGGTPLFSDVVVTDGHWHRIGLIWDGTDRILRADGQEVARGPLDAVDLSQGGLIIGADDSLEPGTYLSGLIDDLRIYNRVVKP